LDFHYLLRSFVIDNFDIDLTQNTMDSDWEELLSAIKSSPTPDDFLSSQDRNTIEIERDPFHGVDE
jgi:hypothetical protein